MSDPTAATSTDTTNAGEPTTTAPIATPADGTAAPATTGAPGAQDEKPAEPAVPESYDLNMPEGVELDKAAADEFTTIAKELKLDNAAAQKLADVGAKMAQRQAQAHAKLVETWTEQVKTDKEIGGDQLEQNLGIARKALEQFGTPELKDVLNSTGLGNHPAFVKAFLKIGKAISEDGFVKGAPKGADIDPARKLFPSMN
jgi:hypothetical protein